MRRRYGSGLTKIMCAGSGVLLAVLLIGAIKMPLVVQKMRSDTGINVSDEWKEQAEEIYEKFMESANE